MFFTLIVGQVNSVVIPCETQALEEQVIIKRKWLIDSVEEKQISLVLLLTTAQVFVIFSNDIINTNYMRFFSSEDNLQLIVLQDLES